MSIPVALRATQDALVNEAAPARNYGERPNLTAKTGGDAKYVLIGFSLKAIPSEANIHTATLRLRLRSAATDDIEVQRIITKWSERRVNWTRRPSVGGVTASADATGSPGDLVEVDVTTMVAAAVERGKPWHGLRVIVDGTGTVIFHSSEVANRNLRPVLRIEYSVPPPAPTRLRPRGGNAVNASQPKLAWDTDEQSESRVQVHTSDDFTSPAYDSGWELNDEPGWDLAEALSPTFSAIADGATRYWRVAIKDEDGNESPFSLVAQFERRTYGTFSIDSPAADLDAVEDTTPTIITSLTGRTQERIGWAVVSEVPGQPLVRRTEDPGHFFAGVVTDDPSFEITQGIVTNPDAAYTVFARAWDEYDRGTAVGERSYTEDSRQFVYDPSAGVTAVSALAAESVGSRIRLTWTRASSPDSFDIYVDGIAVVQQVDPADVFVSGTSYLYDLWSATPNETHTFMVVATENAQDSISNPTVDHALTLTGLYLVAPDDDIEVWIHTGGPVNLVLGEMGSTFELLNRPSVVRIVDSVRGLEGEVSGRLKDSPHGTVKEERAAFLALKQMEPGANIRVVFPNSNFPVLLGAMTLPAHALPDEQYEVSVQVWQNGEYEVR